MLNTTLFAFSPVLKAVVPAARVTGDIALRYSGRVALNLACGVGSIITVGLLERGAKYCGKKTASAYRASQDYLADKADEIAIRTLIRHGARFTVDTEHTATAETAV